MVLSADIKRTLNKLWDSFRVSGVVDPLTILGQITYLIYLRVLDKEFGTLFVGHNDCRWSYLSGMEDGEKLLNHMNKKIVPFLRMHAERADLYFFKLMGRADFIITKSDLLQTSIDAIEKVFQVIEASNKPDSLQGEMFEYLLEYIHFLDTRTQRVPRQVTDAILGICNPQPGDIICDTFSETGDFLVACYSKMKERAFGRKSKIAQSMALDDLTSTPVYIAGVDSLLTRISYMNLYLHGLSINQIRPTTSNETIVDIEFKSTFFNLLKAEQRISDLNILFNSNIDGGLNLILVPEEVLFLSWEYEDFRNKLISEFNVLGIVSFPPSVFGKDSKFKCSLLITSKKNAWEEHKQHPIWMYQFKDRLTNQSITDMSRSWKRRLVLMNKFRAELSNQKLNLVERNHGNSVFLVTEQIVHRAGLVLSLDQLLNEYQVSNLTDAIYSTEKYYSTIGREPIQSGGPISGQSAKPLNRAARIFLAGLSEPQRALYGRFSGSRPIAIHEVTKKLNKHRTKLDLPLLGLQEAKNTVELLEMFGLLVREPSTMTYPNYTGERSELVDFNGEPLSIDLWRKPRRAEL